MSTPLEDDIAVTDARSVPLLGGALCLDFANTLEWRGTARRREALADYAALLAWARRAGAIDAEEARRLAEWADWAPASAAEALEAARALREAIYRVAAARAAGRAPGPDDLAELNAHLFALIGASRLEAADGGLRRAWGGPEDALEQVLWPVAWSALELLGGAEAARVRECAGPDCHWLFVDRSKNRSRRWCAMAGCGNLAKARRHRRRRRGGASRQA